MNIAFVLDRPELCGGVKVVFQDAELLVQRGVDVSVFAIGSLPQWSGYSGNYIDLSKPLETSLTPGTFDLVIATFWSTVLVAEKMNIGPVVHYCQGYEASYPHLQSQSQEIDRVYAKSHPSFTVSKYLADLLHTKFDKPSFVIPPPIDSLFEPKERSKITPPFNILVSGVFECTWKGVETSLRAVKKLRDTGIALKLTRISLLPQSNIERDIINADAFHCCISPKEVAKLTSHADLVLFASQKEEGFGLPLTEALVCGVPTVAANIASAREITRGQQPLVDPLDVDGFYHQALDLLTNRKLWNERAKLGPQLTQPYKAATVSDTLVKGIKWAIAQY